MEVVEHAEGVERARRSEEVRAEEEVVGEGRRVHSEPTQQHLLVQVAEVDELVDGDDAPVDLPRRECLREERARECVGLGGHERLCLIEAVEEDVPHACDFDALHMEEDFF